MLSVCSAAVSDPKAMLSSLLVLGKLMPKRKRQPPPSPANVELDAEDFDDAVMTEAWHGIHF